MIKLKELFKSAKYDKAQAKASAAIGEHGKALKKLEDELRRLKVKKNEKQYI